MLRCKSPQMHVKPSSAAKYPGKYSIAHKSFLPYGKIIDFQLYINPALNVDSRSGVVCDPCGLSLHHKADSHRKFYIENMLSYHFVIIPLCKKHLENDTLVIPHMIRSGKVCLLGCFSTVESVPCTTCNTPALKYILNNTECAAVAWRLQPLVCVRIVNHKKQL